MSRQKQIALDAQQLMEEVQVASIPRVANYELREDNN